MSSYSSLRSKKPSHSAETELPVAMQAIDSVSDWTPELIKSVQTVLRRCDPLTVEDLSDSLLTHSPPVAVRALVRDLVATVSPSEVFDGLAGAREWASVFRLPSLAAVIGDAKAMSPELLVHLEYWLVSQVSEQTAVDLAIELGQRRLAATYCASSVRDPVNLVLDLAERTPPQVLARAWLRVSTEAHLPPAEATGHLDVAARKRLRSLYRATRQRSQKARRALNRQRFAEVIRRHRLDGVSVSEIADAAGVTAGTVYLVIRSDRPIEGVA